MGSQRGFCWRTACATGRAPLCAPVLLCLFLGGCSASTEPGEVCRLWTYAPEPSADAFQCPKQLDGADAKFCCGTCQLPYCCSSGEARLDQRHCYLDAQLKGRVGTSTLQPPRSRPVAAKSELLMVLVLVLFAIGGCTCFCLPGIIDLLRFRNCWRCCRGEQEQMVVEEFDHCGCCRRLLGQTRLSTDPPYSSGAHICKVPPANSIQEHRGSSVQLCHSDAEDEDEVTIFSRAARPARRVQGLTLETIWEVDSLETMVTIEPTSHEEEESAKAKLQTL
ncbi:uncharacterized protein LOC128335323 [Hemicordylus capensis]|uniref:uncharacterized protein LOC128335323 n=1 Tax=Hemicordylus capensis TaxID=884348 RepID=UPI002302B71C|nr:uncharacterized protein LOC128335323 [Hemicordylus capensis]